MGRVFTWGWIFAALLVATGTSCSSDSDEPGNAALTDPDGDLDGDGIPNHLDDDIDGDGIPNDEDDTPYGAGGNQGGTAGSGSMTAGSGSGTAGSASGGSAPGSILPTFPGAGTSDAGDPLPGGMLCDSVPGQELPIPQGGTAECFVDRNDPNNSAVAATLEQVLECVEGTDTVHIRLTFHPWFVDNTYGVNSIGWPERRGHRWRDLVASDHAEIIIKDAAGNVVLQFKIDYISEDPSSPSGWGTLGVMGGDGSVIAGDASAIIDTMTSLDRNLNERGYGEYTTDSPATDENYTANPETPDWDYRHVYDAWIDLSVFGDAGFGGATIEYVHASPAKSASDTIETTPGECPPPPPRDCPDSDPDADCGSGGSGGTGGGGDPCEDNDPDTWCGEGGGGGTSGNGSGGSSGSGGNGGDPLDPCEDNDPDTWCGDGGGGGTSGNGSGGTSGNGSGGTSGNGGDPLDPCQDNDPDTVCIEGGSGGNGGDPTYCVNNPQDPACQVD